jgi:hypothetical protein
MSQVAWFQREFSKEKEKGKRGEKKSEKWFQAKNPLFRRGD